MEWWHWVLILLGATLVWAIIYPLSMFLANIFANHLEDKVDENNEKEKE